MTDDNKEIIENSDKNTGKAGTDDSSGDSPKKDEYEKVCFLCRRPESKAGKMIELPSNINICTDCMQKSFDSMNNGTTNYSELMQNMPNISMVDLSSIQNRVPEKQRLKKKKQKEEEPVQKFTMKDIPAPHRIKAQLDEYVIGQEQAKEGDVRCGL